MTGSRQQLSLRCRPGRSLRNCLPLLSVLQLAHDNHVERGTLHSTEFAKESLGVLRAEDQNPPGNTGVPRTTLEGFSSILDTVGALANQRHKLRATADPNLAAERKQRYPYAVRRIEY